MRIGESEFRAVFHLPGIFVSFFNDHKNTSPSRKTGSRESNVSSFGDFSKDWDVMRSITHSVTLALRVDEVSDFHNRKQREFFPDIMTQTPFNAVYHRESDFRNVRNSGNVSNVLSIII